MEREKPLVIFAQYLDFLLILLPKVCSGFSPGKPFSFFLVPFPKADSLVQELRGVVRREEEGAGWVPGPLN